MSVVAAVGSSSSLRSRSLNDVELSLRTDLLTSFAGSRLMSRSGEPSGTQNVGFDFFSSLDLQSELARPFRFLNGSKRVVLIDPESESESRPGFSVLSGCLLDGQSSESSGAWNEILFFSGLSGASCSSNDLFDLLAFTFIGGFGLRYVCFALGFLTCPTSFSRWLPALDIGCDKLDTCDDFMIDPEPFTARAASPFAVRDVNLVGRRSPRRARRPSESLSSRSSPPLSEGTSREGIMCSSSVSSSLSLDAGGGLNMAAFCCCSSSGLLSPARALRLSSAYCHPFPWDFDVLDRSGDDFLLSSTGDHR